MLPAASWSATTRSSGPLCCEPASIWSIRIDPETGEPYLKPVQVRLHGDSPEDAIQLPPFLEEAYHLAERFCELLGQRAKAGFFRTILLRRMGSTMEAGRRTVEKILASGRTSTRTRTTRKPPRSSGP